MITIFLFLLLLHVSVPVFGTGKTTPKSSINNLSVRAPLYNVAYAADDRVKCFHNGALKHPVLTKWTDSAKIFVRLCKGDVMAFEVSDAGVVHGMAAAVNHNGAWSSTGVDPEWRAIDANDYVGPPNGWKLPSYNACSWPSVSVASATARVNGGQSFSFPYGQTLAKYVWANGVGGGTWKDNPSKIIYVRRVVGCSCPTTPRPNVHFAADDRINMYVNGVHKPPGSTAWTVPVSKYIPLNYGDVVSFIVSDAGIRHGMVAAINVNGWSSTGVDHEWRAIDAASYSGPSNGWMSKTYDACHWPSVSTFYSTVAVNKGMAFNFPHVLTGAKYVWAHGVGGGRFPDRPTKVIFVRRVVGGACKVSNKRTCDCQIKIKEMFHGRRRKRFAGRRNSVARV